MSNLQMQTFQTKFAPTNLTQHKDSDSVASPIIEPAYLAHQSKPTISQGTTTNWTDYNKLTTAKINGIGVESKTYNNGNAYINWGSSGTKHSEIFRIGDTNNSRWMPGIKGLGFEVFRHRTDSTTFTNDNAKQHCIFIKRYGARFINRTQNTERFWSSSVLATSGEAKGSTFGHDGGVGTYEFYKVEDFNMPDMNQWLLESFWVNVASQDASKVGTANTKVYIYNLRFYYDYGTHGNNRIVNPSMRSKSNRNKGMF